MDEEKRPPERTEPEVPQTPLRQLWDRFGYLVMTVAVTLLLFGVIFLPAYVPTGSMEPTMPTRSFFLAFKAPYLLGNPIPKRQDIVVFQSTEMDEIMVKRLIGLPGDTVRIADGQVFVNDVALEEDYLPAGTYTEADSGRDSFEVPADCVFFLGDNRATSFDSRYWEEPFIPVSQLKGQALVNISVLPDTTWKGIRLLF